MRTFVIVPALMNHRSFGAPVPLSAPPVSLMRPLKKVSFFYACESGVFKQPSEIFDSIVGFSILGGLICEDWRYPPLFCLFFG